MSFRLVPKSVTLNDFERRNGPYYSRPHIASAIAGDCSILVVLFIYYSRLRIAPAIAEDCYILAVFYLFLFPTTDLSTSLGRFLRNFAKRRGVS